MDKNEKDISYYMTYKVLQDALERLARSHGRTMHTKLAELNQILEANPNQKIAGWVTIPCDKCVNGKALEQIDL